MKITTKSVLPPPIVQYYDRVLLSKPYISGDCCARLMRIFRWIEGKLAKKISSCPKRRARYLKLEEEFLELYERAKTKEEELEAKGENPTKVPFYRIRGIDKRHERVFDRLRFKTIYSQQ